MSDARDPANHVQPIVISAAYDEGCVSVLVPLPSGEQMEVLFLPETAREMAFNLTVTALKVEEEGPA